MAAMSCPKAPKARRRSSSTSSQESGSGARVLVRREPALLGGRHARTTDHDESSGEDDTRLGESTSVDEDEEDLDDDGGAAASGDVVQFASSIYIARSNLESDSESEPRAARCYGGISKAGTVQISLMRIGDLRGDVSVSYRTVEISAVAGKHYEHTAGVATIPDGESMADISIGLLEDGNWDPTLEFKVVLERPQHCQRGVYLRETRVKRVDDDCFPSNRFEDNIKEGEEGIQQIDATALFHSFLYIAATSVDGALWKMIATFLLGLLDILYQYLFLNLQVFLVDNILNTNDKDSNVNTLIGVLDRHYASIAVVSAMLAPLIVLYLAGLAKTEMDLQGMLTHWLKCCVYRKYLNLTEQARLEITPSDCVVRIDRDVETVCSAVTVYIDRYLICCRILMFFVFTIRNAPRSWWICISMVLILVLVAKLRQGNREVLERDVGNKETECNEYVTQTLHHIELIGYCRQRPRVNEEFSVLSKTYKDVAMHLARFGENNTMFKQLLNKGFVAMYIVLNTGRVLDGVLPLGAFVAMINVINDTTSNLEALWDAYIEVGKANAPLKDLTFLLNSAIFLSEVSKQDVVRQTSLRKRTKDWSNLDGVVANESCFDQMPIELKHVSFKYGETGLNILEDVSLNAKQGSIIQIIGGDATCKRTLLRLIGVSIYPTEGEIVVPTHLRTMYVSDTPDMLKKSLWDNLVYACPHKPRPERVLQIVDRLQMSVTRKILAAEFRESRPGTKELDWAGEHEVVTGDTHKVQNWEILPRTEVAKINLARALIMNPECLILSKPFSAYMEQETKDLISALIVEHNNERGLAMGEDMEKRRRRRPRTVFVTTSPGETTQIPGAVVWRARSVSRSGAGAPFTVEAPRPERGGGVLRMSTAPARLQQQSGSSKAVPWL